MKTFLHLPLLGVAFAFLVTAALAQERLQLAELADLSLEQLSQLTVTSASRREERLLEAPASIFVITQDDIRRSAATSLPEVLRFAPNLHVARADNNQYAITARGYNNVLANKLLVMIDGRTVYTPLFSGVFWESQDLLLSDVERIEVISGPGATLWGANAVNGIINIITFPASRTAAPAAHVGGGNAEFGAAVRTGGHFPGGAWRAYAKHVNRRNQELDTGVEIRDESERAQVGFRADWGEAHQGFTLQGDVYAGRIDQAPAARTLSGGNLLGRWAGSTGPASGYRVQAYYDRTRRDHPMTFRESLDTFDVEAQHHSRPWRDHQLVVGGGYRHSRDDVTNSAAQAFLPAKRTLHWANVFAQDELPLRADLRLTLGLKAERNPYTGTEWLPNARLAWTPTRDQLWWGALSRAVRAPSRIDRELFFPGEAPFVLVGSDTFESEVVRAAELGWRAQLGPRMSLSATLFHHDYPNLRSVRPTPAGLVFANDIEGRTNGIEGWGAWRLSPAWRLSGGFVVQDVQRSVKGGAQDVGGLAGLGNDPKRKALLRASWDVTPDVELDFAARHVGALPNPRVGAYTAVDLRAAWRMRRSLEASVALQNVLDHRHPEWGVAGGRAAFGRAVFVRLSWMP